ncbi:cytochrome d ubiquinol oxidase subunit II [Paenibacillus sp. JCM 10914]|nr:cytochrome d ubiquinol oxidase subunit II [Paenibacillus sp. JCM 10914]
MNRLISRYLSPVWEITNVFFVFFFVGIIGFFPDTAYYYAPPCWYRAALV